MEMIVRTRVLWFLGVCAVGGLGVVAGMALAGQGAGTSALTTAPSAAAPSADAAVASVPVRTNESGRTYGALDPVDVVGSPDLVEVYGDEGNVGYVDAVHFLPVRVDSPEQALALSEKNRAAIVIPVFGSDGTTQIDTFTINKGAGPG